MSVNKQVKDNWDDSSDEEIEEVQVPTEQVPSVNMQDNCKNCYVCNHDIENDTSYYPQCENKALLDRMKEIDECSSDEEDDAEVDNKGDEYYSDEEGGDEDYPSYDDECELMDKKMGMHIRF